MTHQFSHHAFDDAARAFPLENPMEEVLPPVDDKGDFTKPSPEFKPNQPDPYWAGKVKRHQPLNPPSNPPKTTADHWFEKEPIVRRHAEVFGTDALKAAILRSDAGLKALKRRDAIHALMLVNAARRQYWLLWPRKAYRSLKAWYKTKRSSFARWMGLTALVAMLNPGQLPWLKIGATLTALVMTLSALTYAWH